MGKKKTLGEKHWTLSIMEEKNEKKVDGGKNIEKYPGKGGSL